MLKKITAIMMMATLIRKRAVVEFFTRFVLDNVKAKIHYSGSLQSDKGKKNPGLELTGPGLKRLIF